MTANDYSQGVAAGRSTSGHQPFSIYIVSAITVWPTRRRRCPGPDSRCCQHVPKKDVTSSMPAFKNPGFQERQEAASRARNAALAKYQAKPPIDAAVTEERKARSDAREAAQAARRAAMIRAKEEAAEAKREQDRQALIEAEAASKMKADAAAQAKADATARKKEERMLWTEADRKAARDARYAARKARLGRYS